MEEQEMELEALKAIYMDDLKELEISPPHFELTIKFSPEGCDSEMFIVLDVTFTATYPLEIPILQVRSECDLSQQQHQDLVNSLNQLAEESRGMAMVFTLVSHAKEWLENNWKPSTPINNNKENSPENCDDDDETELSEIAKLAIENITPIVQKPPRPATPPILEGTPVTPENFAKWRQKNQVSPASKKPSGLSGRQLFEQDASLITSDSSFD